MKNNSCIYLISLHPCFNPEVAPVFGDLSKEDSIELYSALTLNHKENLDRIKRYSKIIYVFDERDEKYLPSEIASECITHFINTSEFKKSIKSLAEKYFEMFDNNLIVFSNSMGVSAKTFLKALDLITLEDESFLIGSSKRNDVVMLGFNEFNQELLNELNWDDLIYDNLLYKVTKYDIYLQQMSDFLILNSNEDFKDLYNELSKKESHSYCSEEMHEKFTNLFIEYKDLLK